MKVPRLLPLLPTKDTRLTLKPMELVLLFTMLEQASELYDERAHKLNTPEAKQAADVLWELSGKLQDKLTFRAVAES